MALLELKNVVASYGNINALKGISLSVPEGKIVTLIGANGAGKSTTMRTIMGLMKPKEGDVLFKGNPSWECIQTKLFLMAWCWYRKAVRFFRT